ncbi:MAG: aminotransferase class V-fold PLP-dependent enzyme [Marinilabiliales bacterium]|nr:aminotransferase class V-fold PLP-dependent enzyme [Marinilabiliales bacterium]
MSATGPRGSGGEGAGTPCQGNQPVYYPSAECVSTAQLPHKVSVVSFLPGDIHQYDAGMILDKMGIAVRTGTHCAQPVMDRYGISGTIRASIAFYNTEEEIDALVKGIGRVTEMFA